MKGSESLNKWKKMLVILINKFSVSHEEFDQFLKGWAAEAEKFRAARIYLNTTTPGYGRKWYLH